MFKEIKKLKKLKKLQEKNEAQILFEGFTEESLKDAVKKQRDKVKKDINEIGWLLMFLIVIPFALKGIGFSDNDAAFATYIGAGIIFCFILPRLIGD